MATTSDPGGAAAGPAEPAVVCVQAASAPQTAAMNADFARDLTRHSMPAAPRAFRPAGGALLPFARRRHPAGDGQPS